MPSSDIVTPSPIPGRLPSNLVLKAYKRLIFKTWGDNIHIFKNSTDKEENFIGCISTMANEEYFTDRISTYSDRPPGSIRLYEPVSVYEFENQIKYIAMKYLPSYFPPGKTFYFKDDPFITFPLYMTPEDIQ